MICSYKFIKGKKKDKICSKINCKTHEKKHNYIQELPVEMQREIISYIGDFQILKALSTTCKAFYEIITDNHYEKIVDLTHSDLLQALDTDVYKLNNYQQLSLINEVGCQRCLKNRIKKIYWPFPYRLCKECFDDITIDEYKLKEYGVNINLLGDLDKVTTELWSQTYRCTFYVRNFLIKHVEKWLGRTLNEYKIYIIDTTFDTLTKLYGDDLYDAKVFSKYPITVQNLSNPTLCYFSSVKHYILDFKVNELVSSYNLNRKHISRSERLKESIQIAKQGGDYKNSLIVFENFLIESAETIRQEILDQKNKEKYNLFL